MSSRARVVGAMATAAVIIGTALIVVGTRHHSPPAFEEHLPRRPTRSTLPSTGVSSPADLARVLCRAAVPAPLFSSEPTTVGNFRDTTTGGTRAPSQDTLYP